MKATFLASMMLLVSTQAIAAPVPEVQALAQNCTIRAGEPLVGKTIRVAYLVQCPGTAPTSLSVTYQSSGAAGAPPTHSARLERPLSSRR